MKLTSPSFKHQQPIPQRFTGEGEDVSPSLQWSGVPSSCREFVLICEDPDAPKRPGMDHPFVHWVIYNISPSVTALPEGVMASERLLAPVRADQGKNSFGNIGYGGPMPPVGHGSHRYIFKIYALDTELGLPPGASKQELLHAIEGHVLDSAEHIGTYERKEEKKTA